MLFAAGSAVHATPAGGEAVSVCVAVSRRIVTRARWATTKPCRCVDGRYDQGPFECAAGAGTFATAGLVKTGFGTVPPRHAASSAQPGRAVTKRLRNAVRMVERKGRIPSACKPGSVEANVLRTVISLGMRSPAFSSGLPAASLSKRTASRRLFGLAPAGVYRAVRVTTNAVGSYPTFSPLPTLPRGRFVFCGTVRHRINGAQALPGSLSMEPGLSSKQKSSYCVATVRPRELPSRIVLVNEPLRRR